MQIQELYINNFKSLVDFKLVNPNSFTVFVGPNGAGKSNIFEALEYVNLGNKSKSTKTNDSLFGGPHEFVNLNSQKNNLDRCFIELIYSFIGFDDKISFERKYHLNKNEELFPSTAIRTNYINENNENESSKFEKKFIECQNQFLNNFSRILIKIGKKRLNTEDNIWLSVNADNLEKVLKRILQNETKKEEILDWLHLFVPELENIEVHSDNIAGTDTLLVYEKNTSKPLRKNLISDGTYNILALLTAIYQSDEPQFLCIEEPENGLNPYVVRELVYLCREACSQMGHTIWLNTHSQTLVSALRPEEIILINKKEGITKAKQFGKDKNLFGLTMDEAWLSNALGGGLPW